MQAVRLANLAEIIGGLLSCEHWVDCDARRLGVS